jgi:hypothetical protein
VMAQVENVDNRVWLAYNLNQQRNIQSWVHDSLLPTRTSG